ncbi:MAG: CBS domain-containing protein [Nitrospinaceae bacterium]|nr:CBS domain-containing protein [Nitrospinaceae bacterium]
MDTLRKFLSGTIHTVSESSMVQDAIDRFSSHKATACLVEKNGEYIGIITREDVIHKVTGKKDSKSTPTADIMSAPIYTVDINMSKADGCIMMSKQERRHLVLEENGSIVGIVSVRDMVPEEMITSSRTGAELFVKVGNYGDQLLKDEKAQG